MAGDSERPHDLPPGLERQRHVELGGGRLYHAWARRAGLLLLLAIAVVALSGVIGQGSTSESATGRTGTLTVRGPERLRGGLLYQMRFTVVSHGQIQNAKLVLSPGWFDGMTLNTIVPQPSQQGSRNGSVVLTLQSMSPGERQVVWTDWQVNPTHVGTRNVHADLYDGGTPLAQVRRTITVFP